MFLYAIRYQPNGHVPDAVDGYLALVSGGAVSARVVPALTRELSGATLFADPAAAVEAAAAAPTRHGFYIPHPVAVVRGKEGLVAPDCKYVVTYHNDPRYTGTDRYLGLGRVLVSDGEKAQKFPEFFLAWSALKETKVAEEGLLPGVVVPLPDVPVDPDTKMRTAAEGLRQDVEPSRPVRRDGPEVRHVRVWLGTTVLNDEVQHGNAMTCSGLRVGEPHFRRRVHAMLDSLLDECERYYEKRGEVTATFVPGQKLVCWVTDDGVLRRVGPFTPFDRVTEVIVAEGDTTDSIKGRVLAHYAEKGIKYAEP
jgi:hypothetical protein